MTYRQTFVIEYPNPSLAPRVGADMQLLGGTLVSCQFDDALEELEALHACCAQEDLDRAHQRRIRMQAERT